MGSPVICKYQLPTPALGVIFKQDHLSCRRDDFVIPRVWESFYLLRHLLNATPSLIGETTLQNATPYRQQFFAWDVLRQNCSCFTRTCGMDGLYSR